MGKFLSIIIPRFKESEQDVFPLLTSINNQVGVDFNDIEIIVANDGFGAGPLDNNFLSIFPKQNFAQVNLEKNGGPGLARQAGIDAAKGQYLMFCDADDILHNVGVLGAMMQEADKYAPDILSTSWLEEVETPEKKMAYVTHKHESTWMHGKFLRRQYLIQNGIRHHDKLRVHEDSYLLALATAFTDRQRYLDIVSYVWKYSSDSITRRDGALYTYSSIPTFIYACCEADKIVEQRRPDLMEYKVVQFTLYNYFCFHQPGWQAPEHKEYLDAGEKAFRENIAPFWHYWQAAKPEAKAEVYNRERAKSFVGGMETETVGQWAKRLGLEG